MATISTYYWVVYYPEGKGKSVARASSKRQPEEAARVLSVSVIHRDLYTTQKAEFVIPRDADYDDASFWAGDKAPRIKVTEFHPDLGKARDWMKAQWPNLAANGATYAELHTFEVTTSEPSPQKP